MCCTPPGGQCQQLVGLGGLGAHVIAEIEALVGQGAAEELDFEAIETEGYVLDPQRPVAWEEASFALLPGESRTVVARYDSVADVGRLALAVSGWNIETSSLAAGEADAAGRHAPDAGRGRPERRLE